MQTPILTAVVSTYNSERFLKGCLDNLVRQTIFKNIEVLVVDSGSTQGEGAVCEPYVMQHTNIRYIRTERESLYTAWNRAIGMAQGEFITNANTDDRHRADAYEVLTDALRAQPSSPLAYGDQYISHEENETFEVCEARSAKLHAFSEYSREALLVDCMTGSQPVWRRQLHNRLGLFDTKFKIVGDHDMWLRLVEAGDFIHVRQPLGVYYVAATALTAANGYDDYQHERFKLLHKHRVLSPWRKSANLKQLLVSQIIGIGYHFARRNQMDQARRYFLEACYADPTNLGALRTLIFRGILQIRHGLD